MNSETAAGWSRGLIFAVLLLTGATGCADGCGRDDGFGTGDDTVGDDDATEEPPDWIPNGEAGPSWTSPQRVDDVNGSTPFPLLADDGRVMLFYNDEEEDADEYEHGDLYVRSYTDNPSDLSEPIWITEDAYWPHAVLEGDEIHLVAARMSRAVYTIGDTDGQSWEEVDSVRNADDGWCDGRNPSYLVRTPEGERLLALGYIHHNAVLGCTDRTRITFLDDGEWTDPAPVSIGLPGGIVFWPDGRMVYAAGDGVYVSDDGGQTFTQYATGDSTQTWLVGWDPVQLDDGTILLLRGYNWASMDYLALAAGDPETEQWANPWVRLAQSEVGIYGGRLVRDGDTLVVAWLAGTSVEIIDGYQRLHAFARVSHDNGATWSEQSQLSVSDTGQQVGELALAIRGDRLVATYALGLAWGVAELYVVEATLER